MCGIAGFYGHKILPQSIESMLGVMAHRGPDAAGTWNDDYCTLGHRRLSIIDLSETANQPMLSADGRYALVYNGEVYNFREIAVELRAARPDLQFRTTSDTEVILEAFATWGAEMVNKLNGMFAIAVYDMQKKELHLFRDRMGIKPIYYYEAAGLFAFSSELKGLEAIPEIKRELQMDMEALADYLHLGYIPAPLSIWKQIKKFPQGCMAVVNETGCKIERYWTLENVQKKYITDEQEAILELNKLLLSSVKYRLISDVPFGTFLSGGIDSSIVTALAQHVSSVPVNTFSIGFRESAYNEAHYARTVADYLQTNHHEFIVSERDVLELIPSLPAVYDEPFADDSALPTMLVSKLARKYVTMTLSGDGGDELFMGYGAYDWATRLGNGVNRLFASPVSAMLRMGNARMKRAAWMFDLPEEEHIPAHIFSQEQYYFSRKEVVSEFQMNKLFAEHFRQHFSTQGRKLSPAENQSMFDLHYYLPDMLLVKVDRASMVYSLETRVPLLDYRIVEFAVNIRQSLRAQKDVKKYILKNVLYSYLPKEFFARPKWGFSLPLPVWMRNELRDFTMDYLHTSELKELFGQAPEHFRYYKQWVAGNNLYFNRVWQMIVLSMWLEKQKRS